MSAFLTLSLNRRLAAVAFVLGFLALFAGSPYKGSGAVLNTRELAIAMATSADVVEPRTLADWIIQGRADFRVVDLRAEPAYNEYHIPAAENRQASALTDGGLLRNEKLVLVAEDGSRAAQAWTLLKAKGYRGVYILKGGIEGWQNDVLFPRVADNANAEQQAEFAKLREVSKYFGGTPQSAAGDSAAAKVAVMPKLALPTPQPGGASAGAPKKKKKEGC